jgi:hypothetical protein
VVSSLALFSRDGGYTSRASRFGRYRDVYILVGVSVEGLEFFADLGILARRHVGGTGAGLVARGAPLSIRWL